MHTDPPATAAAELELEPAAPAADDELARVARNLYDLLLEARASVVDRDQSARYHRRFAAAQRLGDLVDRIDGALAEAADALEGAGS